MMSISWVPSPEQSRFRFPLLGAIYDLCSPQKLELMKGIQAGHINEGHGHTLRWGLMCGIIFFRLDVQTVTLDPV